MEKSKFNSDEEIKNAEGKILRDSNRSFIKRVTIDGKRYVFKKLRKIK